VGENKKIYFVEFEIHIPVAMKIAVLWDVTPCSPVEDHRSFGGKHHPHLQV
jgi:hypothetical protein